MKYHKNYDVYINFLSEKFPNTPKVEIIIRNYDILIALLNNDNSACVEEIHYELRLSEGRIREKLRELENEKIIKHIKEKKLNNSYRKKYYTCLIDKDFLDKLREYIYCCGCNERVGKFGGIIHTNRSRSNSKIFCSKKCRDEWCFNA